MQKKIVLTGAPGTGKSSILDELKARGFYCMPEVSREVTQEAQKRGIQQLFLSKPLTFSKLIFEDREQQFKEIQHPNSNWIFFDRGMPDVYAYMDYRKYSYPNVFKKKSKLYKYDVIFLLKPWNRIYISDNERYENFKESKVIDKYLQNTYQELGYSITEVPFGTVKDRSNFILNWLKINT